MASFKDNWEYFNYRHPKAAKSLWYLTWPISCPYSLYNFIKYPPVALCGNARGARRLAKCEKMSAIKIDRQFQRVNRRKSLSLSATEASAHGGLTTLFAGRRRKKTLSDQSCSPLFTKLPREIRLMIWGFAMDMKTIHIMTTTDPTQQWRFLMISTTKCVLDEAISVDHNECYANRENSIRSGLGLLQTCRLIYTEALPILYSETHFQFTLKALNFLYKVTPTSHIQRIRSLSLMCDTNVIACRQRTPEQGRRALQLLSEGIRAMSKLQKAYVCLFTNQNYYQSIELLGGEELVKLMRYHFRDVLNAIPATCKKYAVVGVEENRQVYRLEEDGETRI